MNDTPETLEPVTESVPVSGAPVDSISTYTDNAEVGLEPMYNVDFILNTVCSESMDFATIAEFTACNSYDVNVALISLGNIALGLIIGYVFSRGVFDVWR